LLFLGRMPCLVIGALLAASTNLLFADLAHGGAGMAGFLSATGLQGPLEAIGGWTSSVLSGQAVDPARSERLAWLIAAIAGENLAVGFASVAAMAYMTSIVNPKFAAVQYALLASLTMLIGTLGRAPLGTMIEEQGFAPVFILTFWIGLVAVGLSIAEWLRQAAMGKPVALAETKVAPAE
jgi:PAT family beta-lactamase induction signal transducer AmpG